MHETSTIDNGTAEAERLSTSYYLNVIRDGSNVEKVSARIELARIFERRGMFAEVVELYEANIRDGSGDASQFERLAEAYEQLGRFDLAKERREEAASQRAANLTQRTPFPRATPESVHPEAGWPTFAAPPPVTDAPTATTPVSPPREPAPALQPPPLSTASAVPQVAPLPTASAVPQAAALPTASAIHQAVGSDYSGSRRAQPPQFEWCGWDDEPDEMPQAPSWHRVRPLWLVLALTVLTFGVYPYYWFFATWRELKHEWRDDKMRPFCHVAAIAVIPIYGAFRLWDHFCSIRDLTDTYGVRIRYSPGACFSLMGVAWTCGGLLLVIQAMGILTLPVAVYLGLAGVQGIVLMCAQAALNAAWPTTHTGLAASNIRPRAWAALAAGVLLISLAVVLDVCPGCEQALLMETALMA